ncbi:MAG: hypothetical protein Kow00121_23680 [Elainellaceae cyanobacterium]
MLKTQLQRVYNRTLKEISKVKFLERYSDAAYQAQLKHFADQLPPVDPIDRPIVEALDRDGIFVTTLAELKIPLTSQVLNGIDQLIPELAATSTVHKRHRGEFLIKASRCQLLRYPELFLWGLEERLLNVVENYLGLPAAYHGVYLRRDLANGVIRRTRFWHLDKEDRRMVKIIVYLNDVNEEGGPFQYISNHLTPTIIKELSYDYNRVTNSMMEGAVPSSEWLSCIGPTGTVIFVDPAKVFHRGQAPIASDRFTLFFDYTSRKPKRSYYCKSSVGVSDLIDFAKRLSRRQIDCVFWNKKLASIYRRSHSK